MKPQYHFAFLTTVIMSVTGCGRNSNERSAADIAEYERQIEIYDRQAHEMDIAVIRNNELMDTHEKHLQRHEALLAKMEEQSKRKDAILSAEERRLGIVPNEK